MENINYQTAKNFVVICGGNVDLLGGLKEKPAKVVIHRDTDHAPRGWEGYLGVIASFNERISNEADLEADITSSPKFKESWHESYDWQSPKDLLSMAEKCGFLIENLYLYDHSGIAVSTTPDRKSVV